MAAFLDALHGNGKLLWIDASAYAGKLLAGGRIPWLDVSAYVAWQRKAQGLLKADVIAVPLDAAIEAWLAAHPALVTSMAEKKRVLFPLKTLLADAGLRAHLVELVGGLRSSFAKTPLMLVLPSPRRWIAGAYAQASGNSDALDIGADEIDSAAVYVADFLRAFGDSALDGLVLQEAREAAGSQPLQAAELEWYQPVINVAAHYRWDLGLQVDGEGSALAGATALGFVIATAAVAGLISGVVTPASYWSGGAAPPGSASGFRFAEIPADANPEQVLDRLAALRG